MSDTSPATRAQLATLYAARSAAARLRMATSLFGTAKRLAIAGIRRSAVDLDEQGVRAALFDRLYGDLFSDAERATILRPSREATPRDEQEDVR
ncbi:MAG: hypothetical protein C0497_06480 [Gemmatimonas sp.]|nr:hypothetical protein [Gemmatimonas sp.]